MNILVFGDSITEGFFDHELAGWCNRLVQHGHHARSKDGQNVSVYNLGISGDNSNSLRLRFDTELTARVQSRNDTVLIAIGANDSQFEIATNQNRVELEEFEENIRYLVWQAKKQVDRVFLITILPVDDRLLNPMPWKPTHGYAQTFVDAYNEVLLKTSEEEKVQLMDIRGVFGDQIGSCLDDGIHPNAVGHQRIFERVKHVLEMEGILPI
ncbi:MAG: GDSL-type esterase/lipase family protein [Patescibacteria group bacterium]